MVSGLVPCLLLCLSLPLSLCVRLLVRLLVCALDVSHVCQSSGVSMARIICTIMHMKTLPPPRARGGNWLDVLDTQDAQDTEDAHASTLLHTAWWHSLHPICIHHTPSAFITHHPLPCLSRVVL